MIAQEDSALLPWIFGVANGKPSTAGDFLKSLADAALRADYENYPILRPALLTMAEKYPKYFDNGARVADHESPVTESNR